MPCGLTWYQVAHGVVQSRYEWFVEKFWQNNLVARNIKKKPKSQLKANYVVKQFDQRKMDARVFETITEASNGFSARKAFLENHCSKRMSTLTLMMKLKIG